MTNIELATAFKQMQESRAQDHQRLEKLEATQAVAASQAAAQAAVQAAVPTPTSEDELRTMMIAHIAGLPEKERKEVYRSQGLVESSGVWDLAPGYRAYQEAKAGQFCPAVHSGAGDAALLGWAYVGGKMVYGIIKGLFA